MMTRNRAALALLAVGVLTLACLSSAEQAATPARSPAPATDVAARAKRLHEEAIVIDTHIDVTQRLMTKGWDFFARHSPPQGGRRQASGPDAASHVDYPRMKEGGLDGIFFSIYMSGRITGPAAVKRALEQIETVRQLALAHPKE